MGKLQIAVLGGGYWGKNLIRNFSASEDSEVKIVSDLNDEVLRGIKTEFPFVKTTSNLKKIIEQVNIDTVAIATPPSLHFHGTTTRGSGLNRLINANFVSWQ